MKSAGLLACTHRLRTQEYFSLEKVQVASGGYIVGTGTGLGGMEDGVAVVKR